MIDREHDLAVVCEAKVLTLARSNKPRPVSVEDLALMRRLDELHLDYPFAGARMLRDLLRREGVPVGWRHVARSCPAAWCRSGILSSLGCVIRLPFLAS